MSDQRLMELRISVTFTQVLMSRLIKRLGRAEEIDEYLEALEDDFVTDYLASFVDGGDWPSESGMHDEALACIRTFRQFLKESSSR